MMTTAKGLTSGYVPMGAVFVAPQVAEPFFRRCRRLVAARLHLLRATRPPPRSRWPTSTSSSARDLLDEAARLETTLHERLAPLAEHTAVAEVRSGIGAVAAVQLGRPGRRRWRWRRRCARTGSPPGRSAPAGIQISPAFVMTDEQVAELADRDHDSARGVSRAVDEAVVRVL